jgi:hypothetical protein
MEAVLHSYLPKRANFRCGRHTGLSPPPQLAPNLLAPLIWRLRSEFAKRCHCLLSPIHPDRFDRRAFLVRPRMFIAIGSGDVRRFNSSSSDPFFSREVEGRLCVNIAAIEQRRKIGSLQEDVLQQPAGKLSARPLLPFWSEKAGNAPIVMLLRDLRRLETSWSCSERQVVIIARKESIACTSVIKLFVSAHCCLRCHLHVQIWLLHE